MKPMGKALKAAHYNGQNKEEALNDFLGAYRATPHISTGVAPGDMIFRNGFAKDFPSIQPVTDEEVSLDLPTVTNDVRTETNRRIRREPTTEFKLGILL